MKLPKKMRRSYDGNTYQNSYRAGWNDAIDSAQKQIDRYEKVRKLSPQAFFLLWLQNQKAGVPFDKLVDDLPNQ